ncbi:MAG: hypothetical protein SFU25_05970 [Candidatus Caenarcaniphilales bacterium]|nr:hypothetical protein [Candidatus Caenarcaniphilales bacterium]
MIQVRHKLILNSAKHSLNGRVQVRPIDRSPLGRELIFPKKKIPKSRSNLSLLKILSSLAISSAVKPFFRTNNRISESPLNEQEPKLQTGAKNTNGLSETILDRLQDPERLRQVFTNKDFLNIASNYAINHQSILFKLFWDPNFWFQPDEKKIVQLVNESGTVFLKVFQQIKSLPKESLPESEWLHRFHEAAQSALDNNPCDLAKEEAQAKLNRAFGGSVFTIDGKEHLAVGSIAVTYWIKDSDGNRYVAKFRRESATKEKINAQRDVLKLLASLIANDEAELKYFEKLIDGYIDPILEELNFFNEAFNGFGLANSGSRYHTVLPKYIGLEKRPNYRDLESMETANIIILEALPSDAIFISDILKWYEEFKRNNPTISSNQCFDAFMNSNSKLRNLKGILKSPQDLGNLYLKALSEQCLSLREHQFFHINPHGSNIAVSPRGIHLIDFGAVTQCHPQNVSNIATGIVLPLLTQNAYELARVIIENAVYYRGKLNISEGQAKDYKVLFKQMSVIPFLHSASYSAYKTLNNQSNKQELIKNLAEDIQRLIFSSQTAAALDPMDAWDKIQDLLLKYQIVPLPENNEYLKGVAEFLGTHNEIANVFGYEANWIRPIAPDAIKAAFTSIRVTPLMTLNRLRKNGIHAIINPAKTWKTFTEILSSF